MDLSITDISRCYFLNKKKLKDIVRFILKSINIHDPAFTAVQGRPYGIDDVAHHGMSDGGIIEIIAGKVVKMGGILVVEANYRDPCRYPYPFLIQNRKTDDCDFVACGNPGRNPVVVKQTAKTGTKRIM